MQQILIIGPSWVGDMVMAQSLFMLLRAQRACEIDVLAPGWSLPLLERMPQVRRGIAMPLGHGEFGLAARWRLGRALAGERYDQAIVLPNSLKSALLPWFAGIPRRTGFRGEMRYGLLNDLRALDKQQLPMTVQRFISLGLPPGTPGPATPQPRLRVDTDNQARLRERLGLRADRPAVAFMPGAEFGPAKQWPLPHFATLARALDGLGLQTWILGSDKDRAAGEDIDARAGGCATNLCGRTALADAVDLLGLCVAAVSNDSGLMHVAAALDKPLVAVYGSSTPDHTPPLSAHVEIRYLRLECSPCFSRVCPLGHTRCLTEITPDSVLASLRALGVGAGGDTPPDNARAGEGGGGA